MIDDNNYRNPLSMRLHSLLKRADAITGFQESNPSVLASNSTDGYDLHKESPSQSLSSVASVPNDALVAGSVNQPPSGFYSNGGVNLNPMGNITLDTGNGSYAAGRNLNIDTAAAHPFVEKPTQGSSKPDTRDYFSESLPTNLSGRTFKWKGADVPVEYRDYLLQAQDLYKTGRKADGRRLLNRIGSYLGDKVFTNSKGHTFKYDPQSGSFKPFKQPSAEPIPGPNTSAVAATPKELESKHVPEPIVNQRSTGPVNEYPIRREDTSNAPAQGVPTPAAPPAQSMQSEQKYPQPTPGKSVSVLDRSRMDNPAMYYDTMSPEEKYKYRTNTSRNWRKIKDVNGVEWDVYPGYQLNERLMTDPAYAKAEAARAMRRY